MLCTCSVSGFSLAYLTDHESCCCRCFETFLTTSGGIWSEGAADPPAFARAAKAALAKIVEDNEGIDLQASLCYASAAADGMGMDWTTCLHVCHETSMSFKPMCSSPLHTWKRGLSVVCCTCTCIALHAQCAKPMSSEP